MSKAWDKFRDLSLPRLKELAKHYPEDGLSEKDEQEISDKTFGKEASQSHWGKGEGNKDGDVK